MSRTVPRRRASRGRPLGRDVGKRAAAPAPTPALAYVEDPVEEPVEADETRRARRAGPDRSPSRRARAGPRGGRARPDRWREIRVKVGPDDESRHPWWATSSWCLVVLGGLACLVAALVPVGPAWLDGVGAVAVVTAYTWALAARTGGRPVVFGGLALVLGVGVLLDRRVLPPHRRSRDDLRRLGGPRGDGRPCPASGSPQVARECCLAVLVAGDRRAGGRRLRPGALPGPVRVRDARRCRWWRCWCSSTGSAPGWHGLGRRGLIGVLVGGAILTVLLLYAELLRRYGPPDLVTTAARRRPLEPRQPRRLPPADRDRARRPGARLGRATCGPGAGRAGGCARSASPARRPVANSLVNPAISLRECGLSVVYGLVVGLLHRLRRHPGGHRADRRRRAAVAGANGPAPSGPSRRGPPPCSDARRRTRG